MAINDTTAIINAVIGKDGYIGTLNGFSSCGSFFRSCNIAIIEMIYNVNAPKTEMVIISAVFPVSNAMMPMSIFTINALEGV